MSYDTWPPGAGVRPEPGRAKRSGSRRSNDSYVFWLDTMEPATRGRAIMIFVDRGRFYANLKTIRVQLAGTRELRDVNMKPINERIRAGIVAYAEAIKTGQVDMDGKPAWPIFMRTWPKYVHAATPVEATDDEVVSGEKRWDE